MNRFFQAFKDLYNCDNPVKRHLLIMLLLLCPAIMSGLSSCIDKSVPKAILICVSILFLVVAFISIFPVIIGTGTYIDFLKSRLRGEKGIPMVNWGQFITGIKLLPISCVWGIYYLIALFIVLVLPNILGISYAVKISTNIFTIITVCVLVLYDIVVYLLCLVAAIFFFYIVCEYAEADTYKARFFNPLVLFQYMKKFFVPTVKALMYYIIASLIVGVVFSVIYILLLLLLLALAMVLFSISPSIDFENLLFHPGSIALCVLVLSVLALLSQYMAMMLQVAYADLLTKIYVEDKKQ